MCPGTLMKHFTIIFSFFSWPNFIYVLLALESGIRNAPKPGIFEKDAMDLRKIKIIGFCSQPMIMFDFYR